ncbi:sugar phosphate isomerase/epimerase [Candidatus Bathyarchaeota archaeon]|nr:sugar phosphate isomerase/epimerase [Candidatus Bathyarchaeota archaeon]
MTLQLGLSNHPKFDITLDGFLEFACRLEASHVELKVDCPVLLEALFQKSKVRSLRDTLESYNLKYILHAPSIDVNLASLNPQVGKASLKAVEASVHLAAELNAKLIVSHVGRLSRDYPESLTVRAYANVIGRLREIVETSKNLGVVFTIENDHKSSDRILAGYASQVYSLIRDLDCKLTFDIGHANTLGEIQSFLECLCEEIVNVHLHDNDGVSDSHLPLGEGGIDYSSILDSLKRARNPPILTLECHSIRGLEKDMLLLRSML